MKVFTKLSKIHNSEPPSLPAFAWSSRSFDRYSGSDVRSVACSWTRIVLQIHVLDRASHVVNAGLICSTFTFAHPPLPVEVTSFPLCASSLHCSSMSTCLAQPSKEDGLERFPDVGCKKVALMSAQAKRQLWRLIQCCLQFINYIATSIVHLFSRVCKASHL